MFDKASYILAIVLCKVLVIVADDTTVETIVIATTTELVTVVTDIPQSDVELAMNLDYGTYTTEVFPYINSQYDGVKDTEKCFEDYTKCLITQGPAHPVCAMNNPFILLNREEGFVTFNSHCDIYFDNCQKQMRFWRIIDSGKCDFRWTNEFTQFDIHKTRKFFEENLPFFLKKIAKTVRKL